MSRYRLTGRVETGELSELYAGLRDEDEPVVLKLFHAKTSDVRYAQELAETARQLGTIRARGIVRYLEIGLLKDRLAVVRQAVEGVTLGQVLSKLTSKEYVLPPPLAMWVIIQVLETVQLAHDAGAIHGALTPGNILLDPDGFPAICDFGALKALHAVPGLRKSFAGRGRDAYRAPEVAKGDEPSIESDIYSLGAITYELLTLREPIGDRSGTMSTRSGILPPPSRLDRRLNARLDPIVMRALELSEGRRFRGAGEFATALRNFLANNGGIPPADDLHRFLEPLRPKDAALNLGPVPVADAFVLREVRGADLPPVTERTQVVELRPSFSGPRPFDLPLSTDPAAETMQASPLFEEYREPVRSSGLTDPGEEGRPSGLKAVPRGMLEPKFEEDTSPSHAGPLEKGWEAPSGAPPPKPRNPRGGPQPQVVTGRPVARNPRVKFIEDFSSPETDAGGVQEERTARANLDQLKEALAAGAREKEPPKASGPKGMLPPPPRNMKVMEITGPLDYAAMPPDTNQGIPKPLNTSERYLADDAKRRKRMLMVALGLAFIGAFSFALAIRRYGTGKRGVVPEAPAGPGNASEPYDPAYQTVNGALKKYFRTEEEGKEPPPLPQRPVPTFEAPGPALTPPQKAEAANDPDDSHFHRPPPRDRAAFLSLTSDIPAIVYIDDQRVKRRTPLLKYPVQPGVRKVVLESVESGDRRNLELAFEKGKLRKVEQKFRSARPKR